MKEALNWSVGAAAAGGGGRGGSGQSIWWAGGRCQPTGLGRLRGPPPKARLLFETGPSIDGAEAWCLPVTQRWTLYISHGPSSSLRRKINTLRVHKLWLEVARRPRSTHSVPARPPCAW